MTVPDRPLNPLVTLEYEVPDPLKPHFDHDICAWSQNGLLVARRSCGLPQICIKCGQPAVADYQMAYYRYPFWLIALIIPAVIGTCIGIPILAIIAMAVRKRATIHLGLCQTHRRRHWQKIGYCSLVLLAGVGLIVLGISAESRALSGAWQYYSGHLVLGGLLVIFIAILLAMVLTPFLYPKKMDKQYVWYSGAGEKFLDHLPSF